MPERMTDERNFRSSYYEKVGCRSVEERKSLKMLLEEKPINKMKLKQFCLWFTIPTGHRNRLWNLLLGVFPLYIENNDFILEQRTEVYQDLLKALQTMKIIDDGTPSSLRSKAKIYYAMFLLENKQLHLGFNIDTPSIFTVIAECLLELFDNDVETYWICKGFYELTQEIAAELPKLIDLTKATLEKEDPDIYSHLVQINALTRLPYEQWYTSCFASVLPERSLIRIWDKIVGGSIKIVVFVLVTLLITNKRVIIRMGDIAEIIKKVESLKDDPESVDIIVGKAIELWQQNKGHNEFQSKTKSNN